MSTATRLLFLSAIAAASLVMAGDGAVAAVEPEILANPDPILARRYLEGTPEIERLREIALDGTKATEERLAALEELTVRFPDAVLTPAAQLASDADAKIALFAAKRLAAAAVMSDHGDMHGGGGEVPAFLRTVIWRHETARAGLQRIIEDSRPEIRGVAATSLATLSDPVALTKIQEAAKTGLYSDTEVANYCGLADPDVGISCMQGILDGGSPDAQATAVSYLGSNPEYQPLVRDKYLFDPGASLQVRSAAASVLGQFDTTFSSYATTLTADPSLPPEVYAKVIEGYVAQSRGEIGSAQAQALKAAVQMYAVGKPGANVSDIVRMLDAITEQ